VYVPVRVSINNVSPSKYMPNSTKGASELSNIIITIPFPRCPNPINPYQSIILNSTMPERAS
jgi:hypothetical protein